MTHKHTKGPWVIQGDDIVVDGFTIGGVNIEDAEKRPEEAKANLQLMAAAPDMLEALEYQLVAMRIQQADGHGLKGVVQHNIDRLEAIIAKAKGGQ